MIIGSSAIQHFVSRVVSHTPHDTTDRDAYTAAALAGASAPVTGVANIADGSTQSSNDSGYNESFAKMMVNLKAALANTTASVSDDDKAAAAAAFSASSDKQVAASDSVSQTVDQEMAAVDGVSDGGASSTFAQARFLAYMNQTDAEKMRQQLTGVSKEEYDKMTPEQQAAVDKKVAELQQQKQEQQIAEQEVKARIAMAKAEMA
ncbi:hypothetical protein N5D61_01540 [Pseudomonas sp. GD03842]|uniref:hypothetical protein n=1 Tax=unclassified Pseudomonas TaxID=196821 RepID=UPI000D3517FD|nr:MULTISPECIES: hypothetical protein [unclassified Pseudomonas]MDH0745032.1 hypothetical protein [Pseudomonas sp. GD03842]RAU48109.1 hypothetical protein DBP26_006180 [Pseudomonas sp. RIT 409]RAU55193.1 hypothetical protein DBY65_004480 [Pseudomonas sp. RIT 412]